MPWPCDADMGSRSPRPSREKSALAVSWSRPSILFRTPTTRAPRRRISSTISISSAFSPARASRINSTSWESSTARQVCACNASASTSSPNKPPVSTTVTGVPSRSARPYRRSRVSPGTSATSASRVRVKRLKSVDLPTLGRPTSAIVGISAPQW